MSTQTRNFKIGPCSIQYDGEFLGLTNNASSLNFNCTYRDIVTNRTYDQPIERVLGSILLSLHTSVSNVDKAMEYMLDENKRLTMDKLGERQSQKGKELLIVPINPFDKVAYRFPNAIIVNNGTCSLSIDSEYGLELEFEANYIEDEKVFFEVLDADTCQRINASPVQVSPVDFERAMTAYIAEKLNLTVDTNIIRGGLPLWHDMCSVELVQQRTQQDSSQQFTVKFSCINESRDYVMETLNTLKNQFPAYGESIDFGNGVNQGKTIIENSSDYVQKVSNDGRIKNLGQLSLIVVI